MARLGSWIRFAVGILLAGEVVRQWIFGNSVSMIGNILATVFLGLVVMYLVFRF